LYLWMTRSPNGPSAKFHVQNIHTMDELKMTGNCLKGSRGICVFDGGWDSEHWALQKEMFTHVSRGAPSLLSFRRSEGALLMVYSTRRSACPRILGD
jgi:ribosome biogenesis protein BRX1